eukprot:Opistho-1_new@72896
MVAQVLLVAAVDEKVVRVVIVHRAVVVVNGPHRVIVVDEEVPRHIANVRNKRGHSVVVEVVQVGHPVPRVERSVVARFAHHVEYEVPIDDVRAAKAVIQVDPRAGSVEEDVVAKHRLARERLHVPAHLLAVHANVVREIALDQVPARLVAVRAVVEAHGAHRHNRAVAEKEELVARHDSPAVVVGEEHGIAARRVERVARDDDVDAALNKDGCAAVDRPIAPRRRLVALEERGSRLRERQPVNGHVLHGRLDAAVDAEDRLQSGCSEGRRGKIGGVGVVVEDVGSAVEEPLAGGVELLEQVLNVVLGAPARLSARLLEAAPMPVERVLGFVVRVDLKLPPAPVIIPMYSALI